MIAGIGFLGAGVILRGTTYALRSGATSRAEIGRIEAVFSVLPGGLQVVG